VQRLVHCFWAVAVFLWCRCRYMVAIFCGFAVFSIPIIVFALGHLCTSNLRSTKSKHSIKCIMRYSDHYPSQCRAASSRRPITASPHVTRTFPNASFISLSVISDGCGCVDTPSASRSSISLISTWGTLSSVARIVSRIIWTS
jgi:hypothetical protein